MAKKQHLPELQLQKSLFEVRYAPKLDFFHLLYPAAQKLTGYPHWEVSQVAVTLRNFEQLCSLSIQHNRFVYDQDTDRNRDEKMYIQDALEHLPTTLELAAYTRLGLRRKYLLSTTMSFEELVAVMDLKLLSQNERLKAIMPSRTEDLNYRVDGADNDLKFHVQAGPVKKEEVLRYLEFNRNDHLDPATREETYHNIIEAYPDVAVFVDIDMYRQQEHIPVGEAFAFWEKAQKRVRTMVRDFGAYLFDTSIEV